MKRKEKFMNSISNTKTNSCVVKNKLAHILQHLKGKLLKNPKSFIAAILFLTLIFTLGDVRLQAN